VTEPGIPRRPVPPEVLAALRGVVGREGVRDAMEDLLAYECDAMTFLRGRPDLVVTFRSTDEVAPVVRILAGAGIPFTPWGAGTGLAGGAACLSGGALLVLSRLKRIIKLDPLERWALVEPGVVNLDISEAAIAYGLCFAPDPSSQTACTIGGNVAANSGGPHTLKYGVTTDHVLGLEAVLPDGRTATLGGPYEDAPGLDWRGLLIGSEGTLGVVTKIWVRLVPLPASWKTILAAFPEFEDASRAVSDIIAAGMVPAALEMMDRRLVRAVEESFHLGLPLTAGAVLIVELDGSPEGLDRAGDRAVELCRGRGAFQVRVARSPEERASLWEGRKKAAAAVGRLAPSYGTHDVVVPRTLLPEMARKVKESEQRHGLRIGMLAHGGDGNLHPLVLYDQRIPEEGKKMHAASEEIARGAVELGGTITGEHGVGAEKVGLMAVQFSPVDLGVMRGLKKLVDPRGLSNPGKVLPPEEMAE